MTNFNWFQVLHSCLQAGINIRATVCDMDGVNRRALTILGANSQQPCINVENKEIFTIFDVPHLLKCFRNLFIKYNIECDITSENKTGKGKNQICYCCYFIIAAITFFHQFL